MILSKVANRIEPFYNGSYDKIHLGSTLYSIFPIDLVGNDDTIILKSSR